MVAALSRKDLMEQMKLIEENYPKFYNYGKRNYYVLDIDFSLSKHKDFKHDERMNFLKRRGRELFESISELYKNEKDCFLLYYPPAVSEDNAGGDSGYRSSIRILGNDIKLLIVTVSSRQNYYKKNNYEIASHFNVEFMSFFSSSQKNTDDVISMLQSYCFVDMYHNNTHEFKQKFKKLDEDDAEGIIKKLTSDIPDSGRNTELDEWLSQNYKELTKKITRDFNMGDVPKDS